MISFKLNGKPTQSNADQSEPLLHILANDLGVNGPKFGCGLAQCGSCTVLVNGDPLRSCVAPLSSVQGRSVTTISGLATQGPTGAALANAVFDATGVRFRTLPLTPDRVLQAL